MNYMKQAVARLIDEYERDDPYLLASRLGIDVEEYPFRKIKGLVIEIGNRTVIALNSALPEPRKRAILAHELGHWQLATARVGYFFISTHTVMEPKVEYEANRFAAELLAGNEEPEPGETLERFAARTGVPVKMMRHRAIKERHR